MNSVRNIRYSITVSLLVFALPISIARFAFADDSGADEAKKRKAAIAAILQAGGDIKVFTIEPMSVSLDRLSIYEINLREAEVDNTLLVHVGNLKEVRQLDLSNAKIDDEGLKHLIHLPLRELWLQSTDITDASAATISEIKSLDFLQLNATKLSDVFLKQLAPMPKLEDLGLRGTLVTGEGMQHLQRHSKLRKLHLYHTDIDDAGVESLTQCKALTSIGLSSTKVTNRVFEHLAEMPNLTDVDLSANRSIRTELVRAFETAFPKCDIEWYRK